MGFVLKYPVSIAFFLFPHFLSIFDLMERINMKRIISSLLLFFFLFSTSGFSINLHSCGAIGKKTISISLPKCCCMKMKIKDGCCHNESKLLKVKSDFASSFSSPICASFIQLLSMPLYQMPVLTKEVSSVNSANTTASPPGNQIPFRLLFGTIRI